MSTCSNNAYEAISWTCQSSMARALLRRHRDVSTVRAMIVNQFGHAPSIQSLTRLRASLPRERPPGGDLTPFLGDVESHKEAMETGSLALVLAIREARAA